MKKLTFEDKLGYWLERYVLQKCSAFDIFLIIEDYYIISENEVNEIIKFFLEEIIKDENEDLGIDEHIDNFIINFKNKYETTKFN
jgi:hypothetical protein